jgi:hypothetical protein
MTNKKGPSSVTIALVTLAAMTSVVACSSDNKNDAAAGAGKPGVAGSGSNATSGTSGASGDSMAGSSSSTPSGGTGGNGEPVDYTTCAPQKCDAKAKLDFDFSGMWNESLVFNSNDCDPSLQPLLPPGFMMNGATLSDVIVGNCVRPTHDSSMYTGSIALDLSEAQYCTTSKQAVGAPVGDVDLVSHVKWTSIKADTITGTSAVYVVQAGCTMVGDYKLISAKK